jgi:serine/threonine protein kinase
VFITNIIAEIKNNQDYNSKCDVYSFSIVMWEMFTLQKPYTGSLPISIADTIQEDLSNYSEMKRNYIKLMLDCNHSEPKKRPPFDIIYNQLKKIKQPENQEWIL